MKSQIHVLILALLLLVGSNTQAQPKLSIDLGLGFYEPTMSGFDENEGVQFPTKSLFNRNLLFNWSLYYQFFSNARIGYNSLKSYEIGELELPNSKSVYRRSITYRIIPIETFFRWKPKIELNFTLAPIWGRGRIQMDTTPGDKSEDWNQLLNSFGDEDPMDDMGATDAMLNDWVGYSSMMGFRYYLSSRLALDIKAGFMNNSYKQDKWRLYKVSVKGPKMKIDDLPVFTFKVVYGLR